MGDYTNYILAAYGVAFAVLAWLALSSVIRLRARQKQLDALERATGRSRRDDET